MAKPNERIYNVFDRNLYRYGNAGYSDVSNGEPLTTNSIIDPGQIGSGTITTTVTGTENWARYTPIVSDSVNLDLNFGILNTNKAQWYRVGNIVTVFGTFGSIVDTAGAYSVKLGLPPQFTLMSHPDTEPYGGVLDDPTASLVESFSATKVKFEGTSTFNFRFDYVYSFEVI